MLGKVFYLETKNGTLWYTEVDGKLFDSNPRGFVFPSLHLPKGTTKKDLQEFDANIALDNISLCETNSVVLNEK